MLDAKPKMKKKEKRLTANGIIENLIWPTCWEAIFFLFILYPRFTSVCWRRLRDAQCISFGIVVFMNKVGVKERANKKAREKAAKSSIFIIQQEIWNYFHSIYIYMTACGRIVISLALLIIAPYSYSNDGLSEYFCGRLFQWKCLQLTVNLYFGSISIDLRWCRPFLFSAEMKRFICLLVFFGFGLLKYSICKQKK